MRTSQDNGVPRRDGVGTWRQDRSGFKSQHCYVSWGAGAATRMLQNINSFYEGWVFTNKTTLLREKGQSSHTVVKIVTRRKNCQNYDH